MTRIMAGAAAILLLCAWWSMVDAQSRQVPRNCVEVFGPGGAPCNSDSDCCNDFGGVACRTNPLAGIGFDLGQFGSGNVEVARPYCCFTHGISCSNDGQCCPNPITLPAARTSGQGACRASQIGIFTCCAPFGTLCEKDSDCCLNNEGKPSQCYKAEHLPQKYCRP